MPEAKPAPQSLREKVQARRAALQSNTTETFDVPGYEGILKVRYRVLSWREITRINERVGKIKGLDDADTQLYVAADTLIVASEAVYDAGLDADKEGDDQPAGPKWGVQLAHDLGFPDPTTPRQAVFAIFARDTQVITHWQTVMGWQDGENETVDGDLVGESEGLPQSS
jgi:hypothetical protein